MCAVAMRKGLCVCGRVRIKSWWCCGGNEICGVKRSGGGGHERVLYVMTVECEVGWVWYGVEWTWLCRSNVCALSGMLGSVGLDEAVR